MRSLPPLAELRAFEAAARHLSFKDAAAELAVTPTAVSHQIRLLERYCGQPLFRRRPRPLALTRAGAALFPVVREGLDRFAETLAAVRQGPAAARLRVTTTNAFAARWLVPRLPSWRQAHPSLRLDIAGTDAVLDLAAGEADLAIRYARAAPPGLASVELLRDRFFAVASPTLLGGQAKPLSPEALATLPLIECEWLPGDTEAPTWQRWSQSGGTGPRQAWQVSLSFREELHAIEATIAGQGVMLCSDVLVAQELADGRLLRVSDRSLPGYGFYIAWPAHHPRETLIARFVAWARGQRG